MSKQKLSAKEVMKDLRAGMSNAEIMEKYKISEKGLVEIEIKKVKSVVDDTFGIWKGGKAGIDYVNEIREGWKKRENE